MTRTRRGIGAEAKVSTDDARKAADESPTVSYREGRKTGDVMLWTIAVIRLILSATRSTGLSPLKDRSAPGLKGTGMESAV